jgi:molecular chaperone DnaK (HSP70)
MSRELVLGIDFGSSSTIGGVLINDQVQLVHEQNDPVIPSVVYVPDRGPPEVGRKAVARQLTEPGRVVRSIKRIIGLDPDSELARHYASTVPFKVERVNNRMTLKLSSGEVVPEQIAGWILERMRSLAEARFGAKVKRIVLTMSAASPPGYREAAIRAARVAQLEIAEFVAEPIAGTLALDLHRTPGDRRIVVCDFGGGTFDVSAVVQRNMAFTPVATHGDHYLGGDDLDHALAEAIAGTVFRTARYDMHKDLVRWNQLLLRCELSKRALSGKNEVPFVMREAYRMGGQAKDLQLTLDRTWVRAIWTGLFDRVCSVVEELLRRAGWTPESVDHVGMIGGTSLVPMVREALARVFPPAKLVLADAPELAVAQGATLLTARHRREGTSGSIPVLLDDVA